MVLGIERELNDVTDGSSDVGRAVHQLAAWANRNRVSCACSSSSGGGGGPYRRYRTISKNQKNHGASTKIKHIPR
jgi:hypothetical protein